MAKKSFKENPALSFISRTLAETTSGDGIEPDSHTDECTHDDVYTDHHVYEPNKASIRVLTPAPTAPGNLIARGESKSKRLQLLVRPSTHAGIARMASAYHTSVNDIINQVLEDFLRTHE